MSTHDPEEHDTETMGLWDLPAAPTPAAARISAVLEWVVVICATGGAVLLTVAGLGSWTEWLGPLLVG